METDMNAIVSNAIIPMADTAKYARAIAASKAVRWDIDNDVIRGRRFDVAKKYLPDGLSLVQEMALSEAEMRFASQIQGRTYANVFGLVERFITAKLIDVSREHTLGDQNALEALVRFSDEEIKHQILFRRIEAMMAETMPAGYRFDVDSDAVARAVLAKSTWSVLVLTLHIELFVQLHYRQSIEPDNGLSELFKDVFLFHWKDEAQHSVLDELELKRHDATLSREERERAVGEFIDLVVAVDAILQVQAKADAAYFGANCGRKLQPAEAEQVGRHFLKAYRWQYIFSGAGHPRFQGIVKGLIGADQMVRIEAALGTLV
ncbi:hypothetical protein RSO01_66160 [Reyranella soli]|uniref:Uncharacterized protein n=2 Tax=Reyranella soli TaxID=1230389 RepID=A0A512NKH2_9HYPH|nr:hypothetical protein RSO01_66160 [Reyranella soli]